MSEAAVKKIPYGISDYAKIKRDNYYYVDKTLFLKTIEDSGNYLFFIRPRRFGKSLFLSLIESYFSVLYKDRFDEFFQGTWIYNNATESKNKFLVLRFSFSAVDPLYLEESFTNHIRTHVNSFLLMNSAFLKPTEMRTLKTDLPEIQSASDILARVVQLCRLSQQKLYINDEYDNFANTILSTSGKSAYEVLTRGEGFFRTFFNFLKDGTSGTDAPISRLFITGVSPVTLDDVTSGFNIGENISLDADMNHALGFTRNDVQSMIDYYREAGLIQHQSRFLLEIMEQWYDNYLFSEYSLEQERLFNCDMILYFLKEYFKIRSVPGDLIDRNVRIDYGKLRHLIIVDKQGQQGKKESNGNFSRLRTIIEEGEISSKIVKGFPLEELNSVENFTSLLFYFGLLTIAGKKDGLPLLTIPNQTVKTLFYDYIIRISKEIELLDINTGKLDTLLHGMAYHGN